MKISVITVSYNRAATIEETIESVLSQNYYDLEYIIIDGGSSDGTVDIIKKYESKLTYWISEPDKGVCDAYNKGIRQATGELICIINSDDILLPNVLNIIAEQIKTDTDIIYGNTSIYRKAQNTEKVHYSKDNLNFSKGNFYGLMHPAILIKKCAYDNYGLYDISCKYVGDKEIMLRMYEQGAKFQRIDLTIARFSTGGATGVRNYYKVAYESMRVSIQYGSSSFVAKYRMCRNITQIYLIEFIKRIQYFVSH
jgi:glycosyltransferase involved in cell wall biosynthesis